LQSESVFAALLWAGVLPLLDPKPSPRGRAVAIALLLAASLVRSIGIPVALLAAVLLAVRGSRRSGAVLLVLALLAGTTEAALEARSGAQSYSASLAKLSFWQEGEYPGFFDVDESGATIRQATDERGPLALAREKPHVAARIVAGSARAALLALLPFVVVAPFAASKRALLPASAIVVGALVPL